MTLRGVQAPSKSSGVKGGGDGWRFAHPTRPRFARPPSPSRGGNSCAGACLDRAAERRRGLFLARAAVPACAGTGDVREDDGG